MLALVASLTLAVLVLSVHGQIFDTNFQTLWEATALLNGDHPYRDFFEWGLPLQAAVSAGAQLLLGHRLLSEFLVQWLFIVAGAVISFHLGVRVSHSIWAPAVTTLLAAMLMAATPTYQYPKLFFYPAALWSLWRYMDRPGTTRSAVLGLTTAAAFLFRHDHGVYIGITAALAFVLTRVVRPSFRSLPSLLADGLAYAAAAAAVSVPWAIVVHLNEGLPEYVRSRAYLFADWSAKGFVHGSLLTLNPLQAVAPDRESALAWLHEVALLIPVLLVVLAALEVFHSWRERRPIAAESYRLAIAAALLIVIESQTFKQSSYVLAVAPLACALGARLLAPRKAGPVRWLLRALGLAVLAVSVVAAVTVTRNTGMFREDELSPALRSAFRELLASPAIDGYQPADAALRYERGMWLERTDDHGRILMRYLRDCTRRDDRLLVTGSTPYSVGYYTGRSIAGGHLFWHHGWRSDPAHELESLALLQRQSVPFVLSTTEPILEDFKRYPRIFEHLASHYTELEGSRGRVLFDTRRQATGEFGRLGFPCFR